MAYGLHLHTLGGSAAEANRFARDYGVAYRPAPVTRQPAPTVTRVVNRPAQLASED
ncbi:MULTISPECIES: DUF6417 family protein [unclassified Streptomyces]|uniref:DUF6417 family protein n=1 Tax=unclassified Streptomyces TaxID=2593676 RepID=UPI002E1FBC7A|nr:MULTISPECIES: DUF6417 family protein [unclassified Streptomyces]